jgi:drug/metabolite transporter (DMT)-like permease
MGFVISSHRAFLLALGSVILFSSTGPLVKFAQTAVTHWQVIFIRSAFATVLLLPSVLKRRPFLGHRKGLLLVRGILGTVGLASTFYAIGKMPLVDAILIFQTAPVFVIPFSYLLLKEKPTLVELLLLVISLAGIALVVKPTRGILALPAFIGLGGAICAGFVFTLLRVLGRTERVSVNTLYFTVFGMIGTAPQSLGTIGQIPTVIWLTLAGMSILFTVGNVMLNLAYRMEKANRVALLNFVQVPLSALWGFLFFSEVPDMLTVVGGILVVGSILFLQTRKRA